MNVSRYVNSEIINFTVEFLTPCFLGGADQNAELRVAPFKAGLRYWWRVLYGAKYSVNLLQTENEIFGSTDGKSNVIWNVVGSKITFSKDDFSEVKKTFNVQHYDRNSNRNITIKINPIDYLAYGKYKYDIIPGKFNSDGSQLKRNVYQSTYINPESEITFSVSINSSHKDEVKNALKFFILYGGVGARSRNGFGSMYSNELEEENWSGKFTYADNPMSFPVLSKNAKMYCLNTSYDTWKDALAEIGTVYHDFKTKLEDKHNFDIRGLIARPIEAKGENIPENIKRGRFPKNIYMGLKRNKGKFIGYFLVLPIVFYEVNKKEQYSKAIENICSNLEKKARESIMQELPK